MKAHTSSKLNLRILLFGLIVSAAVSAQQVNDSIKMAIDYSWEKRELLELFRFQQLEYYQVLYTGSELNGKDYSIVSKEIWNGKIKSIDTLFQTAGSPYFGKITGDTLRFSVMAGKTSPGEVKIDFDFGRFSFSNTFKCLRSGKYSLRDRSDAVTIVPGKSFYAFAWILPVELSDRASFCAVDGSPVPLEEWGKELGMKHYILFEMRLE